MGASPTRETLSPNLNPQLGARATISPRQLAVGGDFGFRAQALGVYGFGFGV